MKMILSDSGNSGKETGIRGPNRKRMGIFIRTFVLLSFLSLIIISIFTSVTIPRQRNAAIKSLESQAKSVSASIAQVCGNAIVDKDYSFIVEHCMEVVQSSDNILYIVVSRHDGFTLIHTGSKWEQKKAPPPKWKTEFDEKQGGQILQSNIVPQEVFHYSYPLEYSGLQWGRLHLGLSTEDLREEIKSAYINILILSLFCLLIGITGAYLFARQLTNPILALRDGILKIAQGHLSTRVSISTGDEIEGLAISFNKMTEELQRDITERKKAEEALLRSESWLSEAEIIADLGSWDWDLVNGDRSWSKGLCGIFGITPEESERTYKSLSDFLHPDEREIFDENVEKALAGIKPLDDEYRIIRPDGSERIIHTRAVVDFNEEGKAIRMLGTAHDITGHKKIEQERKELEDQLQRAEKMEAIGNLAGGVAHDLNNILSGIVNYPELLLLQLPDNSPLRNSILAIKRSGEKAAATVQDLLTLARRGVSVTEVVNLNDILSEYLLSPEYKNLASFYPDVEVETNIQAHLLNISGSPIHLSKTTMNLVSNATEAMPNGGKLSISTENQYVDRPIRGYDDVKEGDYVVLRVSDTGAGISPEDIDRVFEPFYSKKKMGRSGTGLGMAVIWGTVKDHNGYIDLQSTEGKGTTFTLYFPTTKKISARDQSHLSIDDYLGKGESIIVVDDVEEQRKIASKILKKIGYSVTTVSSGEEAVKYMRNNSADLLILDMIMDPGIDGLETYKRILELHPGQKAIIASGFSKTSRVSEAQRLGAGAYLKKPYMLKEFVKAVRNELDRM